MLMWHIYVTMKFCGVVTKHDKPRPDFFISNKHHTVYFDKQTFSLKKNALFLQLLFTVVTTP